jgi:hypothetical protein
MDLGGILVIKLLRLPIILDRLTSARMSALWLPLIREFRGGTLLHGRSPMSDDFAKSEPRLDARSPPRGGSRRFCHVPDIT